MNMERIGAFEAKNRLSELLQRAKNGQKILITKRNQPVAVLGPVEKGVDAGKGKLDLITRVRRLRRHQGTLAESLKALIEEGREQ